MDRKKKVGGIFATKDSKRGRNPVDQGNRNQTLLELSRMQSEQQGIHSLRKEKLIFLYLFMVKLMEKRVDSSLFCLPWYLNA